MMALRLVLSAFAVAAAWLWLPRGLWIVVAVCAGYALTAICCVNKKGKYSCLR